MLPKNIILFLLALLTTPTQAAGYDVKRFQSFMSLGATEKKIDIGYLIGVSRGIFITSEYSNQKYGRKIFCIPDGKFNEVYNGSISEMQAEIASPSSGRPYSPDTPIEIVMLNVFNSHYLCDNIR